MASGEQHILFILDRSGSMAGQRADVIGGFNQYVDKLKAEAERDALATFVSLVTFADKSTVLFACAPLAEVKPISEAEYVTLGNTALLDATYEAVSLYRERIGQGTFHGANGDQDSPSVLVVVFTDGEENASRTATWSSVQNLIKECEGLGNWTFVYIGAHADAWGQASRMSVSQGNMLDAKDFTFHESSERLFAGTVKHRHHAKTLVKEPLKKFFEDQSEGATS